MAQPVRYQYQSTYHGGTDAIGDVSTVAQIDVVDCGVMTVSFGGFFPDGLALLALRLDRCVTFCSPCDFLLIMTFAAIVVS